MDVHRRGRDEDDEVDECTQKNADEENEWMDGHSRDGMEEGGSMMSHSPLTPQNVFTDSPTWADSSMNMLHPDLEGFTPREISTPPPI